jgi:cation diffusion facilitator family transporter
MLTAMSQQGTRKHDHAFGQDRKKPGETRTLLVVLLTTATMFLEIVAGSVFGSMALLADGLHMASHAVALAIAVLAYVYARRHAHDERFSFGTGKVNSLAGFTGALLLAGFALVMVWESVHRLFTPVTIAFTQALIVATLGLIVNGLSVVILGHDSPLDEAHDHADSVPHDHDDDSEHDGTETKVVGHTHQLTPDLDHHHDHHHAHDHNLRSAYLHVLADALTSFLAIAALLAGKYFGQNWMDPAMGVLGAALVARWSVGLLLTTSRVLLDHQGPVSACSAIRAAWESQGATVTDLHLWLVAPGKFSLVATLESDQPRLPDDYRRLIPAELGIAHATIEVNRSLRVG